MRWLSDSNPYPMKTKVLYLVFAFVFTFQPLLHAEGMSREEIKFTWASFLYESVDITVYNRARLMEVKIYNTPNGDPEITTTKMLTLEQVNTIFERFYAIDFPSIFKDYPEPGLDGYYWIFSLRRAGSAFEYSFWCPKGEKGTDGIVALVKYLVELANVKITEARFD